MKIKAGLGFLCAILYLPALTLAQTSNSPLYSEASFIFRTHDTATLSDLAVDCSWAIPHLPGGVVTGGSVSSLYSLINIVDNGRVFDDMVTMVGRITACWGVEETVTEGPGYPTLDKGIAYRFNIFDSRFIATGTSRLRTPKGFLEGASDDSYGMHLTGADATVWSLSLITGEPLEIIGSLTSNNLANPTQVPGYEEGAFITLRIFSGGASSNPALLDALKKSGLL